MFWFTIGMIMLVAVVAVVTILRACGRSLSVAPPLAISPAEASLCPGEQRQFAVEGGGEVTWDATGGTISEQGVFTAGDVLGDTIIMASGGGSHRIAQASVHVVGCTPTVTARPSPTPAPTPTATPTPAPTPAAPADPQGDVGTYENGARVEAPPAGVDIRTASVGSALQVNLQPAAGVPAELANWTTPGEALLWIALYEPAPAQPAAYTDYLFVLDVDGNTATGRPAGQARINPDLGTDAAVGVSYNPATGQYEPYFWTWDPAKAEWAIGPAVVRFYLDGTRTLIGLALPLETLKQNVAQTTGVTLVPEAVKGRAAAVSYAGEQAVVDFYPDPP